MDAMVLKAQRWVNATYGSVAGYNRCAEDGSTGWGTMFALTRALQIELGITSLSDNFGPTTLARLTAHGNVGANSPNMNIRTIAEAGLYCKGYDGGNIDGAFSSSRTVAGLGTMQDHMGLFPEWTISPKVFKALLTMDAYVLLPGGNQYRRQVQQWLNRSFSHRRDFYLNSCDGLASRSAHANLILAIQYTLGFTDDSANGNVGPATKAGLQASAYVHEGSVDSGPTGWVRLFKAGLIFNDFDGHWDDADPQFDSRLADKARLFQEYTVLPKTGDANFDTWMSLLVSTGNPNRVGRAMDCARPLNAAKIATLKANGYEYVGRYLSGGTIKVLTSSEIAMINDNGLAFFPLYQEFGDSAAHFNYTQGRTDATAAVAKAHELGIPFGTVIYFSVDYDALDSDINTYVIQHFKGIADVVRDDGNKYAIGVYGTRNVCSRLAKAGLTTRSFVSGMSTGYSGNMGYSLPANWAFDQVANLTLGGTVESPNVPGSIEIDKNIASGRDVGVTSVTRPRDYNDAFYTYMVWVETRAQQWWDQGNHDRSPVELAAQYLRHRNGKFNFPGSDTVFGSIDEDFITFVKNYPARPDMAPLRDPKLFRDQDIPHFGASFGAVLNNTLHSDYTKVSLQDFGGWAGDLVSAVLDFCKTGRPASEAYTWGLNYIASDADVGYFNIDDFLADVDAFVFGWLHNDGDQRKLSQFFRDYYSTPIASPGRFWAFFYYRFLYSEETLRAAARSALFQLSDLMYTGVVGTFWLLEGGTGYTSLYTVPDEIREGIARAFADVVLEHVH
ncbi:glycoside hydrolase domain-containing protein [Dactylosporangium sp. NPDC051484]|uniref:glycoside hydrolase domain-containing protein n=1 Tax=Dactylosporangium sp. NPDC051484 TaxID=3154942 RepID=UPI00344D24F6